MNKHMRRVNQNRPIEDRLKTLEEMLLQVWAKNTTNENELNVLRGENTRLKEETTYLRNQLSLIKGHTSKMPDNSGLNGDHDRRYHRRDEVSYFPDGFRVGIWGFIPRNTYYLDVFWDTNYGSDPSSPAWSDAYDTYTPELP